MVTTIRASHHEYRARRCCGQFSFESLARSRAAPKFPEVGRRSGHGRYCYRAGGGIFGADAGDELVHGGSVALVRRGTDSRRGGAESGSSVEVGDGGALIHDSAVPYDTRPASEGIVGRGPCRPTMSDDGERGISEVLGEH